MISNLIELYCIKYFKIMLKLYFVECVYIVSDPAACLDVTEKEHEYKRTEVFDIYVKSRDSGWLSGTVLARKPRLSMLWTVY